MAAEGHDPRQDLDALLDWLLDFAQQMLEKQGEFLPFAAHVTTDGELEAVAADVGEEQPPSEELIRLLVEGFRQRVAEGAIRAVGVCADVRIAEFDGFTDAAEVRLEHVDHEPVRVLMADRRKRLRGYSYGELVRAEPEPPGVFS